MTGLQSLSVKISLVSSSVEISLYSTGIPSGNVMINCSKQKNSKTNLADVNLLENQ
jgi:hypothetical protein